MEKTSFRIIFLPTEEGSIESSLFINTSSYGVLSYRVSNFSFGHTMWLLTKQKDLDIFRKAFGKFATWFMLLKYEPVNDVTLVNFDPSASCATLGCL
jgi:hypothetical protein